uniref:Uncharacterized protein n=1 Tax=Cacopsylla melanoneura TaxID=428564 RepID=A0A8D8R6G8_9HEMI
MRKFPLKEKIPFQKRKFPFKEKIPFQREYSPSKRKLSFLTLYMLLVCVGIYVAFILYLYLCERKIPFFWRKFPFLTMYVTCMCCYLCYIFDTVPTSVKEISNPLL